MKYYFNVYKVFNRKFNMRMFEKNIGFIDVYDISSYGSSFSSAVELFNKYKENFSDSDLILLVESEIPVDGTVFNFVPNSEISKTICKNNDEEI